MSLQRGMDIHIPGVCDITELNELLRERAIDERNRALDEAAASRRRMEKMIRGWRLEGARIEAERRGIPYHVLFPERL